MHLTLPDLTLLDLSSGPNDEAHLIVDMHSSGRAAAAEGEGEGRSVWRFDANCVWCVRVHT